ncbi:hypothetical protein [Paenibacillus glucanolyticus]|uniref:hypothetical protein n=1 Tax=Paenibacillus glucanolyticus TaxID=59843 RepID=UPI000AA79077|nr:hypothetical protein [Paenibacillus glucanolyticus]
MTIGISKARVEASLRAAGVKDENIISVVANLIEKNNVLIKAHVEEMVQSAIARLK